MEPRHVVPQAVEDRQHGRWFLRRCKRNLTNRRNILAVRRDTGNPDASNSFIESLAEDAFDANPEAIPYESRRYRRFADTNSDGLIAGREELLPLYLAAATDLTQPLFVYGPPRQIRFGMELLF